MIEDMGSTNGTFVNGTKISSLASLPFGAVIRLGNAILVFQEDATPFFEPSSPSSNETYQMNGPFYVTAVVERLKEAVLDGRHILIVGETGVGKELAAQAIAALMGEPESPMAVLEQNRASFDSEEEANASLLGVGTRIFSDVDGRPGLLEQARGKLLFLDEANALPPKIQKSLLRLLENHQFRRIGESIERTSQTRILFASNDVSHPTAGLIHDLYPRLTVVEIPPLKKRVADIPTIFQEALRRELRRLSLNENHYKNHLGAFPSLQ